MLRCNFHSRQADSFRVAVFFVLLAIVCSKIEVFSKLFRLKTAVSELFLEKLPKLGFFSLVICSALGDITCIEINNTRTGNKAMTNDNNISIEELARKIVLQHCIVRPANCSSSQFQSMVAQANAYIAAKGWRKPAAAFVTSRV